MWRERIPGRIEERADAMRDVKHEILNMNGGEPELSAQEVQRAQTDLDSPTLQIETTGATPSHM